MHWGFRTISLVGLACLLAASAFARPVSLREVHDEFAKRGAGDVKMAYMSGHPVVTAELAGQSFNAVLENCDADEKKCTSLNLKSCRRLDGLSRIEALELSNEFNTAKYHGVSFIETGDITSSMCLKMKIDFPNRVDFGLREVFQWESALQDFTGFFDDSDRSRLAANVLGKPEL